MHSIAAVEPHQWIHGDIAVGIAAFATRATNSIELSITAVALQCMNTGKSARRQNCNFKLDSLRDRQPMKWFKEWTSVTFSAVVAQREPVSFGLAGASAGMDEIGTP